MIFSYKKVIKAKEGSLHLVRNGMKRMVVAVQLEEGKTGKYTLTKKDTGDILTQQEIEQRFDIAIKKSNDMFTAWKEALNGTIYELWYS